MTAMGSMLGARRFTLADQQRFASLSGDFNPVHVDPIVARRTMFGAPVVHGMHAVLWAVESHLAHLRAGGVRAASLDRISALFLKPIYLSERVTADMTEATADSTRLRVSVGRDVAVEIRMRRGSRLAASWPEQLAGDDPASPHDRTLDELAGLSGALALRYEAGALRRAFPSSCELLGAGVVARLLSLTRLVGMECPGLHSLFSSFDLEFGEQHGPEPLAFAVDRVDSRISSVQIKLSGAGVTGTIRAFLRPPPTQQPSMEDIARIVAPEDFAGQRALVVGGSRGLGELLAKIVACGGGHPIVTYRHGHDDAMQVAREIRRWGSSCDTVRLDVARPRAPVVALARTGWTPTHLYYFATPRIFVRRSGSFDARVFRTFVSTYVTGFSATYDACRAVARGPLRVFYPSSVAIDDALRELTEYSAAKAAGESLCRHIERFGVDTRVLVERLPRLPTDQTATLVKVPAADALAIAYDVGRKMAAL